MRILQKRGRILEIIDRFKLVVDIQSADNEYVVVTISKNLKIYEGRFLNVGDLVLLEMSPFDMKRGRLHRDTFLLNDNTKDDQIA